MSATYRAVQVTPNGKLEVVDRELTPPAAGHVRIRVEACGVCRTDANIVEPHSGTGPGRVPGHEVVGVIDAVGQDVTLWTVGDRVGVGFLGGRCGECANCRRGDFVNCKDQPLTGIDVDGGYAEYMTARQSGLVSIPDSLTPTEAAPLLCAGLTTYNAILKAAPVPGSLVAVQGVGGLGHLGLQYAHRMGMEVAAIARGAGKEKMAKELGAHHYIDSSNADVAAVLKELGGADVIVTTASDGAVSSQLFPGLADNGRLVVVGASSEPITVTTGDLILRGIRVLGSFTGTPIQNEDNLAFAGRAGVRAVVEERPLNEAAGAFDRMMNGEARFRMVLLP